jgi:hypothetical protein
LPSVTVSYALNFCDSGALLAHARRDTPFDPSHAAPAPMAP